MADDTIAFKNDEVDRAILTEKVEAFADGFSNTQLFLPRGTEVVVRKRYFTAKESPTGSTTTMQPRPRYSLAPTVSEMGDDYTYSVYATIEVEGNQYVRDEEHPSSGRGDVISHMSISSVPGGQPAQELFEGSFSIVYVIKQERFPHRGDWITLLPGQAIILQSEAVTRMGRRTTKLTEAVYRFAVAKKPKVQVRANSLYAVQFAQLKRIPIVK